MTTTGKKVTIKDTNTEAKQHASEKSKNHRQNQKRNQNMHRNEWKWKDNNPKPMGCRKSTVKGKVHSNAGLPQETRKKVK